MDNKELADKIQAKLKEVNDLLRQAKKQNLDIKVDANDNGMRAQYEDHIIVKVYEKVEIV